jgi:hypothetical protein
LQTASVLEAAAVPADGLALNIYASAAQLLIVVSAVVALLSFFGCWGAIKVWRTLYMVC